MAAIIIDLDGTLCDVAHRTHFAKESPPNWPAFFAAMSDDTPNAAVVALYDMARDAGHAIIYVSGRPETHRAQTEAWLEQHGVDVYALLLMRRAGDYRQDAIVKRELFDQHISGKHAILFTVDDRDQVVAMWRSLGLVCFQVAEGNF
jgi:phosphoglycolate phosphatase-like HAD superfamily hydrolase